MSGLNYENEYWFPPEIWTGETVFIIGGGPSLKGMKWEALHGKRIIGCNDAYRLGYGYVKYDNDIFPLRPSSSWIQIVLFGDNCWFNHHRDDVVMNREKFLFVSMASQNPNCESVKWMKRKPKGLTVRSRKKEIGWNQSTGAGAINLALLLGAKRVVLLGFDMKLSDANEANWHINEVNTPIPSDYQKFAKGTPDEDGHGGIQTIADELEEKYPDTQILNAGPDSALECFKKVSLESVL